MKTIAVSCLKTDPAAFGVQKYDNAAEWNVDGGSAPNGVSATRYMRRTAPDFAQLTPLAAWLAGHLPECVAGTMKRMAGNLRVEGALTECDALRRTMGDERAAKYIRAYAIAEDQPTVIEAWLFPQIMPNEDDAAYWNRVAAQIVAAGARRVSIDVAGPSFTVQ